MKKIVFSGFMASILMMSGAAFADSAALTTQGYVNDGLVALYKAVDLVKADKTDLTAKADAEDLDDLAVTVEDLADVVDTKANANTVYTKTEADNKFLTTASIEGKQDTIADLDDIKAGAAAGATALQPTANISSLTNDAGYLTSADVAVYEGAENGGIVVDANHKIAIDVENPQQNAMYVYKNGAWSALDVNGTFPDEFNFAGE